MAVWMRLRRHSRASIVEMSAAMYVPFVALLVPFWAGTISGPTLMTLGHVLMVPAMVVAMLRRRSEYTKPHHHPPALRRRRGIRALAWIVVATVAVVTPPAVVGAVNARSRSRTTAWCERLTALAQFQLQADDGLQSGRFVRPTCVMRDRGGRRGARRRGGRHRPSRMLGIDLHSPTPNIRS